MAVKKIGAALFMVSALVIFIVQAALADRTYTSTDDFAEPAESVEVNPADDQLQLTVTDNPYAFVNVAVTGWGTIVRFDAQTGESIGEYYTAPEGHHRSPSRTSVDKTGNLWTANAGEDGEINGVPSGSAVKIGIVIGGTRVKQVPNEDNNGQGSDMVKYVENPKGDYLAPPYDYNTCIDRDGDGLIKTSRGLGSIHPWPDVSDGVGGRDNIENDASVEDAEDECILVYQRLPAADEPHHVSVDRVGNVWIGGYPAGEPGKFYLLDGQTGAEKDSFDAADIGCGGWGGLVGSNGVLWSADNDFLEGALMYYNPADGSSGCISVPFSYGLAEDTLGFIWNSSGFFDLESFQSESRITKIDSSDFTAAAGFPKSTNFTAQDLINQGLAVSPLDNNIWVARGFGFKVLRLDNDGNLVKEISLPLPDGDNPTGVAVDIHGKVWVTNTGGDSVMRIDPRAGADNLGEVDFTFYLSDFGVGAAPENFSHMTGYVPFSETSDQGTWTAVHDGQAAGTLWDTISWNSELTDPQPEGTRLDVEARAAESEPGLEGQIYEPVVNGSRLSLIGRFIQIRVTLTANDSGDSPVLTDLTVLSRIEEAEGMICDADGNEGVDFLDILSIFFAIGDEPVELNDPRDWNEDGSITFHDVRGCVRECTRPFCLPVRTK